MNKNTSLLLSIVCITLISNVRSAEQGAKQKTTAGNIAEIRSLGCAVCKKKETEQKPLKVCSQCKVSPYCSKKCQKTDWRAGHKEYCYKLGIIFQTINPKKDRNTLVFTLP